MGTPAAAICTEALDESAFAVASSQGIPWYPFAMVEHPIGPKNNDELEQLADRVTDRVKWLLSQEATETQPSPDSSIE